MNRLTYWTLILSVAALGGLVVGYFNLSESFSRGFMMFLIILWIPVLAIIRMHSLGMSPLEMLKSVYDRRLTFKRLFGKN